MSGDEALIMIICGVITGVFLFDFFYSMSSIHRFYKSAKCSIILFCAFLLSIAIICYVLLTMASFDVKNSIVYIAFYINMGIAWVGLNLFMLRFAGLHWKYDSLECKNPAAAIVVSAGIVSSAICYSGANIGDGPGWWCVVFAGGLASISWHAVWWLIEKYTNISDAITIDRKKDVSIRFSGFLIASALICGRAAAGDWTDALTTLVEFFTIWPIFVLYAMFFMVEKTFIVDPSKQESKRENLQLSIIIALIYIAIAVALLYILPDIPNNPNYKTE